MYSKTYNDFLTYINSLLNSVNNNKILFTVISVLLSLYSVLAAPKLPTGLVNLFDNIYIKLLFIFMIAYLSTVNPVMALLLSFAVLVSIQILISRKTVNEILNSNLNSNLDDNVPLSPRRAQIIEYSINKAKMHQEFAKQAAAEGNTNLANMHLDEANKQDIKIESALKAKKAFIAAKDAEANGDLEAAAQYINEAQKQNIKLISLVNADTLNEQANDAIHVGNTAEAYQLQTSAKIEENKVAIIMKADEHIRESENAQKAGDNEKAKLHLEEAIKLHNTLNDLANDEEIPSGNDLSTIYSPIDENNTLNIKPIVKNIPENIPENISENDVLASQVHGYDNQDYANY